MEVLIGFCLIAVLLYFWLIGFWYARVLMFLITLPLLIWIGGGLFMNIPGATSATGVLGGAVGAVAAWFLAAAPTHYWRHQMREYMHKVYGVPRDYSDTPLTDSARSHGYR